MDGLSFITSTPSAGPDPARADIACFVGFVARRGAVARLPGESDGDFLRRLPVALGAWFTQSGWQPGRDGRTAEDLFALRDVPVPVDSWDAFDGLFAWDARPVDASDRLADTTLGVAVRSFFAQGGRKCYVVRLGDPWPVTAPAEQRAAQAGAFLPTLPVPSAVDRGSWHGVVHLFGLPDVSFLCLPDVPELFALPASVSDPVDPPTTLEIFVECSTRTEIPLDRTLRGIPAPRCDADGFGRWAALVDRIGGFLARSAREVQFLAAVPLPVDAAMLAGQAEGASQLRAAARAQWTRCAALRTAFVQLVYPWLRTRGSAALPGGLEPPDATFAGVLANSALTRGSWRSAIRQAVPGVLSLEPVLDRVDLARDLTPLGAWCSSLLTLRDRVSVVGSSPGGFRVLSDVTTADDESYRPASVARLLNAILRAARTTGETAAFQNNGEALWTRLARGMRSLLTGLRAAGALAGDSPDDAFEVRCDRSTMTQNDLDAGRVICRVSFTAASPVVQLAVVLAMDEGGSISLAALQSPQLQAA